MAYSLYHTQQYKQGKSQTPDTLCMADNGLVENMAVKTVNYLAQTRHGGIRGRQREQR